MSLPLRITHGIMAAIFTLSVLIQFNDPNPLVWILIYLAAAITAGLAALNKLPYAKILSGIVFAIVLLWEIKYIQLGVWRVRFLDLTQEWHMTNELVVLGREFYTLIWIGGWMAAVFLTARSAAKRQTTQS